MTIREARDEDFESIFAIWESGIEFSFDISGIDLDEVKAKFHLNFLKRKGIFNYWVALGENERILGWQSLSRTTANPFKEDYFAESSTYIDRDMRDLDIGKLLVSHAIYKAQRSQLHYITAFVSEDNDVIRKVAADTGFIEIGQLPISSKVKNKYQKIFIVKAL